MLIYRSGRGFLSKIARSDLQSYPRLKSRSYYAGIAVRIGRLTIMLVTYAAITWSLFQSTYGRSLWIIPLAILTLIALLSHASSMISLPHLSRVNRFRMQISRWKGSVFLLIFGIWYSLLIGPAKETRFWIHPAICEISREDDSLLAKFSYLDHPRYPSPYPRSVNEPHGGEAIAIADQDFIRSHQTLHGKTLPVVLAREYRFGGPRSAGYSLYAVGDFSYAFNWATSDTKESMKEWSPIAPENALTRAQAEQVLGRELPRLGWLP